MRAAALSRLRSDVYSEFGVLQLRMQYFDFKRKRFDVLSIRSFLDNKVSETCTHKVSETCTYKSREISEMHEIAANYNAEL